jgi:RNA polymerase sigma-70 factor (ECF subfamily)
MGSLIEIGRAGCRFSDWHYVQVDESRFDELYEQHAGAVYGFLAYRTGDPVLAEDLLADVFERVLRARRHETLRIRDWQAWIFTLALNRLRDHARREQAQRRVLHSGRLRPAAASFPDPAEALADREWLARPLSRLSPEEREAVALRYGADLTAKQIAAATGASFTTVEGRIYRALRKLRAELQVSAPAA